MVLNPHISTDRSVDTRTVDSIIASLVTPDMSNEARVLAVFHWIRRLLFHGDGPRDLAFDFGKLLRSMGNGSCLRQTAPMAMLLDRLGFESQSWVHDTHHMIQVRYDDAWHCLDPHMNFFVYNRERPPAIAGIDELRADPSLAFDAVAENRACPGILMCGDSPKWFTGDGEWTCDDGWPDLVVDEPFGRIALRRGETYTRTWMPGEHYFHDTWKADEGPHHSCGPQDQTDTPNWPLYEPHPANIRDYPSYRHWSAGKLVYAPDLRTSRTIDDLSDTKNLICDASNGLISEDPSADACLSIPVTCPYVITAGSLFLVGVPDGLVVEIEADGVRRPLTLERGEGGLRVDCVTEVNGSWDGYVIHIRFKGALSALELTTHFQINAFSLPYLVPGPNTIHVTADQLDAPLNIAWTYAEGPDWSESITASRTFEASGSLDIDIAGEKYPRNIALTLNVDA